MRKHKDDLESGQLKRIRKTGISSWENIAAYQSREEAVEALVRVKDAMENGLSIFEL